MSRTNIDLDDELVDRVMRRYGFSTKRAAVNFALRSVAGEPMSREEALAMEGSGWHADLCGLRDMEVERARSEGNVTARRGRSEVATCRPRATDGRASPGAGARRP